MGTDGAMASRRPRDDPQGMLSRPNHINRTVSRRREERGNSNEFQIEETLMNYLETGTGVTKTESPNPLRISRVQVGHRRMWI